MWSFESHIYVFLESRAYKSTCFKFASYIKCDNRNNESEHTKGQIKPTAMDTGNPFKARLSGMFDVPVSNMWLSWK